MSTLPNLGPVDDVTQVDGIHGGDQNLAKERQEEEHQDQDNEADADRKEEREIRVVAGVLLDRVAVVADDVVHGVAGLKSQIGHNIGFQTSISTRLV